MNGDFSRWTALNAAHQMYKGVLMQQGRPQTDSDWNEQVMLGLSRSETALADVIGPTGTPKGEGGFAITEGSGGFAIGAGRYYLDGALVENDAATSYDDQGDVVAVPPLSNVGGDGTEVVVFLEANHQHVTALEDNRMADPALAGIDTATRIRAGWRVGVETVQLTATERDDLIDSVACGTPPNLPGWGASTGQLSARTLPAGVLPPTSDCEIPPEAGYLSQENQLYHVKIIRGGSRAQARYVWSRENGSVLAALARNSDGDFILQGDREDEALSFKTDNWVEVFDEADTYNMRSGSLHRITVAGGTVTFAPAIADFNQMEHPLVRRWDHGGNSALGLTLPTTPTELERGIEISFTNGSYREGDYWVFEARAATGNIVWPQYPMDDPAEPVPPMGWGHRRAALALGTLENDALTDITDLRAEFPHLTCLQAEDVGYDDSICQMGAATVQEAIDLLCQRTSSGLCTIVVSSAAELITAVGGLSQGQSVRICLRAGQFQLPRTLVFGRLGHVTVVGTGPQTIVSVANGEAAFAFKNCASVQVTDMSVNGGPTGHSGDLVTQNRLGAITVLNCGHSNFERLRLRCRAGLDRQAACLSTRNTSRSARILVRDCIMHVGQSQTGVQIIGAQRAIVQDNLILPVPIFGPIVRRRITNDPVLVARLRKSLISFSARSGQNRTINLLDVRGGRGRAIPLSALSAPREQTTISVGGRNATVIAQTDNTLARRLLPSLQQNRASRISSERELREHLINLVNTAIRDTNGRARIGPRQFRLVDLGLTDRSYIAQGITIAGASVEEAQVTGNRIEGAIDGIRIAASSDADPVPASWIGREPPNIVRRARITGNVIGVRPLSETTDAHGIYLGHVESVSVGENELSGPSLPFDDDRPQPHFGLYQHGYRGARLTITENTARSFYHGFAVVPTIDPVGGVGIWRLRDNATRNCARPYALASDIEVF
ncbi:hypothetical protein ROA7450_03092 [Roseovarius albus]|uniref:Right handed beta helix domain-containing protein n=1 Tax=Roseovarius albus TaxID=1247867 RepID=A0A1X6ZS49_9RHOB|nr:DUF6519 domain-containing protein [Roseovarius albus]SLN59695.1 hypothetical protein ROA7450_03092 [Roseovarius albus]